MLPGLALLFLTVLSACAVAPDKELVLSEEARPWITITLEEGALPSIQFQLQEVKRGKARQFFGLMGKRVRGNPPIQPERIGHQQEQLTQDLLGRTGPSAEVRNMGLETHLDTAAFPQLFLSTHSPPGPLGGHSAFPTPPCQCR